LGGRFIYKKLVIMITMSCIGSLGRLGNQMFQYAALRSLAKKFKYDYCLPLKTYTYGGVDLFDCFKLYNEERKNLNYYKIESKTLGFDPEIFNNCPDNVDLYGYFQDVKYFEDNKKEIKEAFNFQDNHLKTAKSYFYNTFTPEEDIISLHIRRGDYLNLPHFPVQSIDYYIKALKFFNKNLKVLIFTDDIKWAQKQDIFKTERFFFSSNNNEAVDLCLQTFCKYHIIANSTYSWWGAWLADSKKVIKPKLWFDGFLKDYTNFLNINKWIEL
jgi:hypothetical protein